MKTIFYSLFFISILLGISRAAEPAAATLPELYVFYSPTCHRCTQIKAEILPYIEAKFKGRITIGYYDISNVDNYKLLIALQEREHGQGVAKAWPMFYLQGVFINGEGDVKASLERLIMDMLGHPRSEKTDLPPVDLVSRFRTFEPFTVVSAGLIDGINPCAFTVIVFFMSFLALQGYRKKELVVIGLAYIAAVFLTYIAIGIGIFGFLYTVSAYWAAARVVNISAGLLCVVLGVCALYDCIQFSRTKSTDPMLLQLPKTIKDRIHTIIGVYYRKKKGVDADSGQMSVIRLTVFALITGFLVSLLEAVCTGQVYLPTIVFVLKHSHLKLQALGYLVLYNVMFIVPLFIVYVLAIIGVSSQAFSEVFKRHLLAVKILMVLLFFGLGVFLLWRG